MKTKLLSVIFVLSLISFNGLSQCWNLTWSDEFNGTSLDQTKWNYQTGDGCPNLCGWGNNELEYYTNSTNNVSVSGGNLSLTARYQPNYNGTGKNYTSGKLVTSGKFSQKYGRYEARIKVPSAAGIWPAFWMLADNTNWPATGEIDILECANANPTLWYGTLHYGTPGGGYQSKGNTWNSPAALSNDFHLYAVEWDTNEIRWYIDNVNHGTITKAAVNNGGGSWPFDAQNFYIILNVAVGGNFTGQSPNSAQYPVSMLVDYVKVYQSATCTGPQEPFGGTARNIPGKIEAEDYDTGGEGVAYHDASAANEGNAYRTDGVDIEATTDAGAGYNVGYTAAAEWLEYTVNVNTAGTYTMDARVAATAAGKKLHVELDGATIGTINVPNTGGWQTWQTVSVTTPSLSTGKKILRVYMDTDGINLNYVNFSSSTPNNPPTVSITSPANNASFNAPANIIINANASDSDGSIAKVEFFNGTTKLGEDATSPYSFAWNNVAAGSYSITAIATDDKGATKTSTAVAVTVNVVQSPYGGTVKNIPGKIEAEEYDLGGQGVAYNDATAANEGTAFRTDGVDIEATTDAGGGYNVGWTAAGEWLEYTVNVVTAGAYTIDARVAATATGKKLHVELDGQTVGTFNVPNTGGWQTWQTVSVTASSLTTGQKVLRIYMDTDGINLNNITFTSTIPNNVPTVSITSPANNASFNEGTTITINADASDSDGSIAKVEFYRGTTKIGEDATTPYSINWSGATAGTYSLTAKATDDRGAVTTSTAVSVTVIGAPNNPPTVSITSPSNNTSFNAPANITINADASDSDGSVAKVEFFNGSTKLGEDATSPYSFAWNNVAAGTFSITAKATDNKGVITTSTAISVTVKASTNACSGVTQYTENGGYVDGSKVQNAGSLYQCKPYPYTGWCNGAAWAYAPGTGAYWQDAWTLVGPCSSARSAAIANSAEVKFIEVNPNPIENTSSVKLKVADANSANVTVINSLGEEVYKTTLSGNLEGTIDLSGMESGIYVVKISASNGLVYFEKMLKY